MRQNKLTDLTFSMPHNEFVKIAPAANFFRLSDMIQRAPAKENSNITDFMSALDTRLLFSHVAWTTSEILAESDDTGSHVQTILLRMPDSKTLRTMVGVWYLHQTPNSCLFRTCCGPCGQSGVL